MMSLFECQWRSNPKGQGRIRIASPLNFDAIKFYEKLIGNIGEDGVGG